MLINSTWHFCLCKKQKGKGIHFGLVFFGCFVVVVFYCLLCTSDSSVSSWGKSFLPAVGEGRECVSPSLTWKKCFLINKKNDLCYHRARGLKSGFGAGSIFITGFLNLPWPHVGDVFWRWGDLRNRISFSSLPPSLCSWCSDVAPAIGLCLCASTMRELWPRTGAVPRSHGTTHPPGKQLVWKAVFWQAHFHVQYS